MKKYILSIGWVTAFAFGLSSCSDFLDELPDNRTELTPGNVSKLLVSAYPTAAICEIGEVSSDNADAYSSKYSSTLLLEDLYKWQSPSAQDQDSPHALWESCYMAISTCNMVLNTIEKAGNPASLSAAKGEALVCRAYAHFLLANVFCKTYSKTAGTDLGIPYEKGVETSVSPHYERGTLENVYKNIESDLLAGMELISDNGYSVPKYHFTKKAAYAFAARFYLYYVQPDKSNYDNVIKYADKVLGSDASASVRDWKTLGTLDLDKGIMPDSYVSASNSANLLLVSAASYWGYTVEPYSVGERYAHGPEAALETCRSNGPWGEYKEDKNVNIYHLFPWSNSSALPTKIMLRKVKQYTEMIDPVAGIIRGHIVNAAFTTDETLLCRAEAYIMKGSGSYPQAIADLNVWQSAYTRATKPLTVDIIDKYYGDLEYYQPLAPTVKKRLNPDFNIADAAQENLIHCVLHARRILTLHEGLRWFDIKRYGIVVSRRFIDATGKISVTDELGVDDPRRALQIPNDAVAAGMQPNPRN